MILIAFSWDDGPAEDLKMMDLSSKFNIPGMFFIPATNPEREVLNSADIRKIDASGFEIGAHTYSHEYLTKLSLTEAENEIVKGKDYLEQLLGKSAGHFCFPGGQFNKELTGISRKYFDTARTADTGALVENNSFLIRPAIHFYDRGKLSLLYNSAKNLSLLCPTVLKNIFEDSYFGLLKRIIADINKFSGTHRMIIWGHSWEIEKYSLWNELDDFFQWLTRNYSPNLRSYSDLLKDNHS
jgi:peptidoglycan-N-acetylglucosamine deacetylase